MKKLNCILLIDDNAHDNYFHTKVITESDACEHIKTATNGDQALEYLGNSKRDPDNYPVPDLIFLDINMPGKNGFEFLEAAREKDYLDASKSCIIVMLTSSLNPNDEQMVAEKFSNEVKDFKNKPLTKETLLEILENFW